MNTIGDISIGDSDVRDELWKLNVDKSCGPDNIHPKLLKALSRNTEFVHAISELFRCCADTGKIPVEWKVANVVALHKNGSRDTALNYRPVSLTSILCKVYEKFVRKHILGFMENKITTAQHGFVNKRSCLSTFWKLLMPYLTYWREGIL